MDTSMKRSMRAAFGLIAATQVVAQSPIQVPFNTKQSYGPDGPWQAVTIQVGATRQNIDLYPGGWFETDLISSSVCTGSSFCSAQKAGVYDSAVMDPVIPPGNIQRTGFVDQWDAGPETNLTGTGKLMLDQLGFNTTTGQYLNASQVAISLIENASIQLPNGTEYPLEVGNLALGAPTETTSYPIQNNAQIIANLLPGFLTNQSQTPSNSFGLHIGSVPQGQTGSLIFGGYDQSRVVGTVGVYSLGGIGGGEPVINMIDVSLGVEQGATPFNTSNIGSLYVPGNSHNASEPMSLNPTVPYMQMPIGTCETVAEYLPVTLDANTGLYFWNTNDPRYQEITTSAAFMSITFAPGSGSGSLVIKVPFSVMDLTLTSPIVSQATQYWPCKPVNSPDDRYFLGRAFLQAAYLAISWDNSKFFLAQAAGPESGNPSIQSFTSNAVTMGSVADTTFATSWNSRWTIVNSPQGGLSTGDKAGIVIGGAAVLCLITLAVFLVLRRRRRRQTGASPISHKESIRSQISTPLPPSYTPNVHYANQVEWGKSKPLQQSQHGVVHELYTPQGRASEMSWGRPAYMSNTAHEAYEADSVEIGDIPLGRQTYYR